MGKRSGWGIETGGLCPQFNGAVNDGEHCITGSIKPEIVLDFYCFIDLCIFLLLFLSNVD